MESVNGTGPLPGQKLQLPWMYSIILATNKDLYLSVSNEQVYFLRTPQVHHV